MKSVFAPHLNRQVKFGRLPRRPGEMHLHFSDFITQAKLPPIPATFDYSAKAMVPLKDIYGNDNLGDCAIAMMFHAAAVFVGNATGVPYHAALAQVIKAYSAVSGYVPGDDSTDQGCVLTDVFRYWQKTGLPNGEKILGFISINASSFSDVMAAGYLFENLCFGVGLPDSYVNPFPAGDGFTWTRSGASDQNNGHAFIGLGGVASGSGAGVKIDTWGLLGTFTPDAVAAYAGPSGGGELWSVITADIIAKGQAKAPNGVAWGDLIAAFDGMGGSVPVPVPDPVPGPVPPVPAPPGPAPVPHVVTLAQAEAWAQQGLKTGPYLLSNVMAERAVVKSLQANWPKS